MSGTPTESFDDVNSPSPAKHAIRVLRRAWPLIILCMVVAGAIAYVASAIKDAEYQATSALLFGDPSNNFGEQLFGSQLQSRQDPQAEASTNVRLVSLTTVATLVSRSLGGTPSPGAVRGMTEIQQAGSSDLVTITVTSKSPRLAARIANSFATEYVTYRRRSDQSKLAQASRLVKARIQQLDSASKTSELGPLQTLEDRLSVLSTLQTGNAEVVQQSAVPTTRSSPRPKRSALFGIFLGLILGLGVAFVRDQVNRRVGSLEELESLTGWPVLATVPRDRTLQRATGKIDHDDIGPEVQEASRLLRARLRYFNVDRPLRRLLVTSSAPGEGKSTVTLELAVAYAEAGARVLLVEADLRRPTLGLRLGIGQSQGLSELLTQQLDRSEVIHSVEIGPRQVTVDLLLGGMSPPNPAQLLESEHMGELLDEVSAEYDIVLIDTPPATAVSDAIPLTQLVDGIILVSRAGLTDRQHVTRLAHELRQLNAPTLGVVLNAVPRDGAGYYGYAPNYYTRTQT